MFDIKSILNLILGAGQQAGGGAAGNLGQVLGDLQNKAQQAGGALSGGLGNVLNEVQQKAQDAGGVGGLIGSVLNQAKEGVQQGAGDLNKATGVGDQLSGMAGQLTGGRSPGDLLAQAKDLVANNQGLATAAAAGVGGLLIGTKGGRAMIGMAARLGGLALIGGLAYKAMQNYQAGKPLITTGDAVVEAPKGSGFAEGDGDDEARALLMVRSMIAAAAADGEIDDAERARIMSNLKEVGLDDEAASFMETEFANPLDVDGLIALSTSPQMGAQIYTAARLAIDPDEKSEKIFLANLSSGLDLEAQLVSHIDAAAASIMKKQAA
jgi:uncharacterized membrane protein YebE (DUF533 family)